MKPRLRNEEKLEQSLFISILSQPKHGGELCTWVWASWSYVGGRKASMGPKCLAEGAKSISHKSPL